jgi:hypothetical protein
MIERVVKSSSQEQVSLRDKHTWMKPSPKLLMLFAVQREIRQSPGCAALAAGVCLGPTCC